MYFYRIYGCILQSDIPFPNLPESYPFSASLRAKRSNLGQGLLRSRRSLAMTKMGANASPVDIRLHIGEVDCPETTFPGSEPCLWQGDQDARFSIQEVGCFQIRDGKEMTVMPVPNVADRLLQSWIMATALGLLFFQRGLLVLHGSAAVRGDGAVLILGGKGWGKSTLTSALCQAGFTFLADDLAVIRWENGRPFLAPGPSETRLWPDTLSALKQDSVALEKVHPDYEKRVMPMNVCRTEPAELKRVYILDRGEENQILPLTPKDAFLEMVRHSYRIEWIPEKLSQSRFAQWTQLAGTVPAALMRRRFSLASLSEQVEKIREDYDRLVP